MEYKAWTTVYLKMFSPSPIQKLVVENMCTLYSMQSYDNNNWPKTPMLSRVWHFIHCKITSKQMTS